MGPSATSSVAWPSSGPAPPRASPRGAGASSSRHTTSRSSSPATATCAWPTPSSPDTGEELPAYETFWRRFDELPSGVRAYARKGAEGLVDFWLYPPYEAPHRNEVWQADHFELPNDVIADGCTTALVKPWLSVFMDDRTRKVMGWSLVAEPGCCPGADVVGATICDSIRIRLEQGVEVGGVPRIIRWDNDLSFTAGSVQQLGTAVGFECHAVPPYSGHMKGKVERLGRRVQEQFCVTDVYLRAQLTHRRIMGAGPDDPLFADDTGPLRDRLVAAALRAPATEVGVPVFDLATSRAAVLENSRWRQRWGISVQRLR